jgi:hypothetical protein
MKKGLFVLIIFLSASSQVFSQKGYRTSDLSAGNFVFQNRKVHFDKTYPNSISVAFLEQKLKSMNDPTSGMQVKSQSDDGLNGVMIRYQLDWTTAGFRNWKIPKFLRYPINANFEVARDNVSYRVRVTDIWFTNLQNPGSQQHLALENMVVKPGKLGFTKKKKAMRALYILDMNLEEMFSGNTQRW